MSLSLPEKPETTIQSLQSSSVLAYYALGKVCLLAEMNKTAHKIFYYCYDALRPTGGEKHSYQHVDVLSKNGFPAYVFHMKSGYRHNWFENTTPVVDAEVFASLYDPERDILVFPEGFAKEMLEYPVRRVIFNKNLFYGFQAFGYESDVKDPYQDPNTLAVLAVSDHNASHLRIAYPDLEVFRVYANIRPNVFEYRPLSVKKRQIACVPKATPILLTLYRMFRSRAEAGVNRGASWTWQWLTGKTEREIAEILQDSAVFVFASIEEGLPRLPLEAMSCGCLLAAFRHGPLNEILPPGGGFEYGDIPAMLSWLEQVVSDFPSNMDRYESLVSSGRDIAVQFNEERQTKSVCAAWDRILSKV